MQNKHKVLKVAKALSKIMSQSHDVQVTISGRSAWRTPGRINVPMGDFSCPDIVAMTHGYIDHEVGHEKHTDHSDFVEFARQSNFHKHMLNILEDVRMEAKVGSEYPGAKINLEKLAALAVKRELFAEPTEEHPVVRLVQALCLYHGRWKVLGHVCVRDYAIKSRSLLEQKLGSELVGDICSYVELVADAKSTKNAASLANSIISLLEEELDKQKQQQQQQQQQQSGENQASGSDADSDDDGQGADSDDDADADSDDDGQGADSDDDADADSDDDGQGADSDDDADADSDDDGQGADSDDDADADSDDDGQGADSDDDADADSDDDGQGADSDDDADSDDADADSDDDGQGADSDDDADADSEDGQGAGDFIKALEEMLNASEEDGLDDFHEAIAELLGDCSQEDFDSGELLNLAEPLPMNSRKIPLSRQMDVSAAKAAGKRVFNTLNRVLVDEVQNNPAHRNMGKRIDQRRLAGVPAGNDRIFKRTVTQQDTTAAISFILDASGSMDEVMSLLNESAYAFCSGLQQQHVKTEALYFGAHGSDGLYVAKTFDEPAIASKFQPHCWGGTPTGAAMINGLTRLAVRSETRKILFVITDGDSNNPADVKSAREIARALGIKVIPIGINTGFIDGFDKEDFQSISSISELPAAVKHAVRQKLFA